jgi:Protein of unknown function (DUF2721)
MPSTGLQPIEFLAAMITPAVLISAAALLLLSTVNRLGRVNDRIQNLVDEAERRQPEAGAPDAHGNKHELALEQLKSLLERLLLLRTAVTGMYVSIALLVVTSIAAGMCVAFPRLFSLIPTSVGLLAVVAFLYSTLLLIREAWIAVQATLREITYVRKLLELQGHPQPVR